MILVSPTLLEKWSEPFKLFIKVIGPYSLNYATERTIIKKICYKTNEFVFVWKIKL